MPHLQLELSIEQEFALKVYRNEVKALSQEKAQEFLVEVLRQLMVKDNVIKSMLRNGI